jgi:inosose dehydratase
VIALPAIERILEPYQATGADVPVLSAISGSTVTTADPAWTRTAGDLLLRNLNLLSDRAAEQGVQAVLHPHVGTLVENGDEVQRVLSGSSSRSAWTPVTSSSAARPGRADPAGPRPDRPTPT